MQMACMARDLMTPLESTRKTLSQIAAAADGADSACRPTSTHIKSALASLSIMDKICTETIDNFRTDLTDITNEKRSSDSTGRGEGLLPMPSIDEEDGVPQDLTRSSSAASFSSLLSGGAPSSSRHRTVVLADFVDTLRTASAQACASEGTSPPPIEIVPDPTVPGEFLSDDLKLFRSALHLLTNAARHTHAASGAVAPSYIRMRIYVKKTGHGKSMLIFECRDTGTGVDSEQRQKLYSPFFMDLNHKNTALANHDRPGLGLYSVAINVSSLGGRYGYRPRDRESWDATAAQDKPTGSIFWFAVPLFVSYSVEEELSTADMAAKEGAPPSPKTTRGEKRKMISVQDSDKYDAKEVFDAVSRAMEDSTDAATRAPSLAPAWGMGLGEERLVPIGGPESGSDSGKRALVIGGAVAPSYIRMRIYVKKTGHGKSMLIFECRDTGTGVDSEQRQKLYSPFFMDLNHKNTALANHDRPGLGLYSVAINVSSLGGRYGYRPRDRESWDATAAQDKPTGSIFWFAVPLFVSYSVEEELSTADMAAKEGAPPSPKTTRGEKRKMISVQDSDKYDAKEVFDAVSRAMEDSTDAATRAPSLAPAWGMGLGEERLVPIGGPESGSDSGKRALVIDDSIVIRKSIGKALTNLGFHITYASDGMQGLQALQSAKFDVVFCDFLMPVLDGLDCIEQYRSWEIKHRPDFHQKIVGLSAHAGEEDINRGKKAGMDTFVSKDSKLKDMLNRAIALSETFSSGKPGRSLGGATNSSSSPVQSAAAASSSTVPPSPLDTPMNRLATHPAYSSLMLRRSGLAGAVGVGVGLGKSAGAANSVSALNAATNSTGGGVGDASGGCPIGAAAALLERRRRSSAAAEEEEATPGLECLICEDSRSAARALAGALTAAGWTPHLADDAEHALTMLKTKRWGAAFIEEGGGGADSGDGGGGDGEEEEEELQKLPPGSGRQLLSAFRRWEASHRTVRQNNLFAVTCRSSSNSPVTNGGGACTGSSCPSGFDGAVSRPIEEDVVVSLLQRASARRGDREEIPRPSS